MKQHQEASCKPLTAAAQFVDALKQGIRYEQAISKTTAPTVLGIAKVELYSMQGLKPPSDEGTKPTVSITCEGSLQVYFDCKVERNMVAGKFTTILSQNHFSLDILPTSDHSNSTPAFALIVPHTRLSKDDCDPSLGEDLMIPSPLSRNDDESLFI